MDALEHSHSIYHNLYGISLKNLALNLVIILQGISLSTDLHFYVVRYSFDLAFR